MQQITTQNIVGKSVDDDGAAIRDCGSTAACAGNVLVRGAAMASARDYRVDGIAMARGKREMPRCSMSWRQVFMFDRYGNRRFDEASTTTLPRDCVQAGNPVVCESERPVVNPSVNPLNNRFSTGQGWSYDAAGNVTADPHGRQFTYDAENKQVKVESVDSSGNLINTLGMYFYDGSGARVKKVVPATGEVTVLVYDAGGKLVAEYSTIVQPIQDAKVAYLTADHLGSPRINTDANGNVTARHDYHPFGEEIGTLAAVPGSPQPRTATLGYTTDTIRKQFTGYERDTETGLDFAQARYYNSAHGRFASPDPLLASAMPGNPQSWNRYNYSYNNPLRFTDPSGMIAGDFYNLAGKKIGTDGINDGKMYIVYDKDQAKEIEKTEGNYTGTVEAKITLPSMKIVTAVIEAVNRSDAATFDKSGFTLEKNRTENGGGFREAGITWDRDGNVKVEPDGPYSDPRKENAGMVITPNTEGSAHVHPSGAITTTTRGIFKDEAGNIGPGIKEDRAYIENVPSPADYENAAIGANIMIGGSGKERTATFYNKNGILATMSYNNFKKLGGK